MFFLGVVSPARFAELKEAGKTAPGLHSAFFLPDAEPSIKTSVTSMTGAVMEVLGVRPE
jgi:hippurate hydrolase